MSGKNIDEQKMNAKPNSLNLIGETTNRHGSDGLQNISFDYDDEASGYIRGFVVDSASNFLLNTLNGFSDDAEKLHHLLMSQNERVAYVSSMWMPEDKRGLGHGQHLIRLFNAEAKQCGATSIILFADENQRQKKGMNLEAWYLKQGFFYSIETCQGGLMVMPSALAEKIKEHCPNN